VGHAARCAHGAGARRCAVCVQARSKRLLKVGNPAESARSARFCSPAAPAVNVARAGTPRPVSRMFKMGVEAIAGLSGEARISLVGRRWQAGVQKREVRGRCW